MTIISNILLYALIGILSVVYGYYAGHAKAQRTRDLWQGLKRRDPQSLAVVSVVLAIVAYVLMSYSPPAG